MVCIYILQQYWDGFPWIVIMVYTTLPRIGLPVHDLASWFVSSVQQYWVGFPWFVIMVYTTFPRTGLPVHDLSLRIWADRLVALLLATAGSSVFESMVRIQTSFKKKWTKKTHLLMFSRLPTAHYWRSEFDSQPSTHGGPLKQRRGRGSQYGNSFPVRRHFNKTKILPNKKNKYLR